MSLNEPASPRVTLRRGTARGHYDDDTIRSILAAGLVAHVGVATDEGPVVLPMAYGITDELMYLHGAVGNALLRGGAGTEICATVTLIDGLVMARSALHNSMNYRSVVVRGVATRVDDAAQHLHALEVITDHVVANWADKRPVTDAEAARTMVLALPLAEASAKVRAGDPVDEPEDLDGPYWSGTVPIVARFGTPSPAADLRSPVAVPPALEELGRRE